MQQLIAALRPIQSEGLFTLAQTERVLRYLKTLHYLGNPKHPDAPKVTKRIAHALREIERSAPLNLMARTYTQHIFPYADLARLIPLEEDAYKKFHLELDYTGHKVRAIIAALKLSVQEIGNAIADAEGLDRGDQQLPM